MRVFMWLIGLTPVVHGEHKPLEIPAIDTPHPAR
jgi:hypothetical protein